MKLPRMGLVTLYCVALVFALASWVTQSFAESYQYDPAGRLLGVTHDDGSSITYAYGAAGNMIERQVTVDTTAPTTTAEPAGGSYTSAWSVTLRCDDGTGSGCAATYFTTDGTNPTASSTPYSSRISIDTDTSLKFFSTDNAGNSETTRTESYVIQAAANDAPNDFDLVSPDHGAAELGTSVTFVWKKAADPDGDSLSYQLLVCEDSSFAGCTPTVVAATEKLVWLAGSGGLGGLLLFGMLLCGGVGSGSRRRQWRMTPVVSLLVLGFVSGCGGSDRKSKATEPTDEMRHTVSGLNTGTRYYWKVSASDGADATDSETRSFTTQ